MNFGIFIEHNHNAYGYEYEMPELNMLTFSQREFWQLCWHFNASSRYF